MESYKAKVILGMQAYGYYLQQVTKFALEYSGKKEDDYKKSMQTAVTDPSLLKQMNQDELENELIDNEKSTELSE